jgi:CheY-like chemotaxis protein
VNRRLLEKLLTKRGARVTPAESGPEALEREAEARAGGRPFHATLMDIHMPRMDGIETTQRLREAGYGGLILAVTADATLGGRAEFTAAGFDDLVPKPIDKEKLFSLLAAGRAAAKPSP